MSKIIIDRLIEREREGEGERERESERQTNSQGDKKARRERDLIKLCNMVTKQNEEDLDEKTTDERKNALGRETWKLYTLFE